jgi:hypothetical protein
MVKGFFSFAAEKAGGREGYWNREIDEMVKGFFSFAAEKAGGREGYWNREIDETAP